MKQGTFPGEELRVERERRDLSIEDVYRLLRVPVSCIRALEDSDLSALPPMTYTLGFLKSYCEFLELDPEPYIDCLQECTAPAPGFLGMPTWNDTKKKQPPWLGDALTWLAICAILVLGWITYAVVFQPSADPKQGAVQADTLDMRVPETPPVP